MAVINSKNYFGLDLSQMEQDMFVEAFVREGTKFGASPFLREQYAKLYMEPRDKHYLLSRHAYETIGQINISDPANVFEMILEHSDDNAMILVDKNQFFSYHHMDEIGEDSLCGFWGERVYTGETMEVGDKIFHDYYFNYEAFRIMKDDYSHPDKLKGLHPKIIEFVKALIFIKCSNIEAYPMKPMQKARPPQMADSKWINKSGTEVILVNADWNRMYVKSEGFKVRGHIRFQRHGKENKLVKLIWIDSYEKSGYKRQFHSH